MQIRLTRTFIRSQKKTLGILGLNKQATKTILKFINFLTIYHQNNE